MDHSNLDMQMMRRALALAEQAVAVGEVPVGAVVYQAQTILAEAHNRRESDNDPTAHAELLALRQAAATRGTWRLEDCSMAVTLEPCPMCAGALVNSRIARLVYAAADPKMGSVDTRFQLCSDSRFNHRVEIIRGVLSEPCGDVLRQFFRQRRKRQTP